MDLILLFNFEQIEANNTVNFSYRELAIPNAYFIIPRICYIRWIFRIKNKKITKHNYSSKSLESIIELIITKHMHYNHLLSYSIVEVCIFFFFFFFFFFLMGNRLQCHGAVDLVRPLISLCDAEYTPEGNDQQQDNDQTVVSKMDDLSQEPLSRETQPPQPQNSPPQLRVPSADATDVGKSEGALEEMGAAKMGPLTPVLARLDIRDNAIDYFGICKEEKVKIFEPILCMRAMKR